MGYRGQTSDNRLTDHRLTTDMNECGRGRRDGGWGGVIVYGVDS